MAPSARLPALPASHSAAGRPISAVKEEAPARTAAARKKQRERLLKELEPGTKYLFLCHHKTGTHLMKALCEATASVLTDGAEQCHWCLRARGFWENGTLRCPVGRHNKFSRPDGARFTLISSIDGGQWKDLVEKWAGRHRVVHVVREPKDIIASDYQYNRRLMRMKRNVFDCDQNASVWLNLSLKEQVQNVSYAVSHLVDEMCTTSEAARGDGNVTEIGLEEFEEDFPGAARKMFAFLFGNHSRMERLMSAAAEYNLKAHPKLVGQDLLAINDHSKRPRILEAVDKLVRENDWRVKGAASCQGAKDARSWNKVKAREAVEKMLMVSERYDDYWEL